MFFIFLLILIKKYVINKLKNLKLNNLKVNQLDDENSGIKVSERRDKSLIG